MSVRPHVFILSSVHDWQDTRIFHKEAVSLAKYFEVELHAPADFEFHREGNVSVHGLPRWDTVRDRRILRKELKRRVRRSQADVFHLHDPELIPLGFYIKLIRRRKVIFDLHENVGQTILTKKWLPVLLRRLVFFVYKILEKTAARCFDQIIIAETSYGKFITHNVTEVLNYPLIDQRLEIPPEVPVQQTIDVIYIGDVTMQRGVFSMLEAASLLAESIENFNMLIIGQIRDGLENRINDFLEEKGLSDSVSFTGRLPYPRAMQKLDSARVGLATLLPHGNYLESIPTKVLEYMFHGVPFVASNFPYWSSFLASDNAGVFVNPNDSVEIAAAVGSILSDPQLAKALSSNGRQAVRQKYNWKQEEMKLLECYQNITGRKFDIS